MISSCLIILKPDIKICVEPFLENNWSLGGFYKRYLILIRNNILILDINKELIIDGKEFNEMIEEQINSEINNK